MAYDPAATRANLLDAAFAEFAERGLAGARVDRITQAAGTNKQAIYFHFGSKEQLFDTVVETRCNALITNVPFSADDLAGYVGEVFDYLLDHQSLMRMIMWQQLERPNATEHETESYQALAQKLTGLFPPAVATPDDAPLLARTLLMLTIALSTAWATATPALRAGNEAQVRRHVAIHRRAVVTAATATITALTTGTE